MKAALLALIGLVGIGLLTWMCTDAHRPMIEADLTSKTQLALAGAHLPGIGVSADGLRITLRGEVPDAATKKSAGDTAAATYGVVEVENLLTVKPGAVLMTKEDRKAAVDCQAQFKDLLTEPVRFATASAVLDPRSYPLMGKLAAAAKLCPAAQIEIGGHTDPRGELEMNMQLSQARANSVKAYLEKSGITTSQLSAVGYGPNKPIADNATTTGMEKNRRTEFIVKGI